MLYSSTARLDPLLDSIKGHMVTREGALSSVVQQAMLEGRHVSERA